MNRTMKNHQQTSLIVIGMIALFSLFFALIFPKVLVILGSRTLNEDKVLLDAKPAVIDYYIDNIVSRSVQYIHLVEVGGWAFIHGESAEGSEIRIVLRSDAKQYIFPVISQKRPDVTSKFKALNYDDSGFKVVIREDFMEKGSYKLGIYIEKGALKTLHYTDKTIEWK